MIVFVKNSLIIRHLRGITNMSLIVVMLPQSIFQYTHYHPYTSKNKRDRWSRWWSRVWFKNLPAHQHPPFGTFKQRAGPWNLVLWNSNS